jgi:hypothetical protein
MELRLRAANELPESFRAFAAQVNGLAVKWDALPAGREFTSAVRVIALYDEAAPVARELGNLLETHDFVSLL